MPVAAADDDDDDRLGAHRDAGARLVERVGRARGVELRGGEEQQIVAGPVRVAAAQGAAHRAGQLRQLGHVGQLQPVPEPRRPVRLVAAHGRAEAALREAHRRAAGGRRRPAADLGARRVQSLALLSSQRHIKARRLAKINEGTLSVTDLVLFNLLSFGFSFGFYLVSPSSIYFILVLFYFFHFI